MMQNKLFFMMLIGTLCFGACKSTQTTGQPDSKGDIGAASFTDSRWKLTELDGKPVPDSVNGKEPYLHFEGDDSSYSGTAGCNGIGGKFELLSHNRIRFSRGMSTMMACKNMVFEKGLVDALGKTDHYIINGNILLLKEGNTVLAQFHAINTEQEADALSGIWELNYISGPRIAFQGLYPEKKPTISFHLPETKASGNSSCNNYQISFSINQHTLTFADPVSTKMACKGAGEATFFKTLKMINGYSVSGTTLTFVMGDVAMMRFEKKKDS